MKLHHLLLAFALLSAHSLKAGAEKICLSPEETSPWAASLSTGWDSLYMFRGVNQIPGYHDYGSSISWTAAALTWSPTEHDSFTLGSWMAFGIGETSYKEIDGTLTYTRTIGSLSLSAGYSLYAVLSEPGGQYSNELNFAAAYEFTLGPVTLTPGINYDFTLGPEPGNGGYIKAAAGYLELRLDGDVPVYREILHAAPWVALGFSFDYNTAGNADNPQPYTGADHVELGLTLPIAVSKAISVAPYVAYSYQWVDLAGTERNTWWGGVAVNFSF